MPPVTFQLRKSLVHDAHAERVRHGARYVTDVMFDREERWNIRVTIEGLAGGGQLVSQVEAQPSAILGPFGLVLSSLPFLLMAGIWWRAAIVRQRVVAVQPASART